MTTPPRLQYTGVLVAALLPVLAAAGQLRDRSEVRAFRSANPCPATGQIRGACPGWHVDHIIALCGGGPDKRENMQWITREDHRFKTLVDVRECRKARATSWKLKGHIDHEHTP